MYGNMENYLEQPSNTEVKHQFKWASQLTCEVKETVLSYLRLIEMMNGFMKHRHI
jgi:hypothetical protein